MWWSQLSIVEIDEALMRVAGDTAEERGLRGYAAVHLAAARHIGADVFSSADRRLFRRRANPLCMSPTRLAALAANALATSR
jgi:predicted nucleic acid-binding protein